jgi:hypothetical protein
MESRWADYNLYFISNLQPIKDIHVLDVMTDFSFSKGRKVQWMTEQLQVL